jgi:hypothetical protein
MRCRLSKTGKTSYVQKVMRRLLNDGNVLNIIGRLSLVYIKK